MLVKTLSELTIQVLLEVAFEMDLGSAKGSGSFAQQYRQLSSDMDVILTSTWMRQLPVYVMQLLLLPSWLVTERVRRVQEARRRIDIVLDQALSAMLAKSDGEVSKGSFVSAIRSFSQWPGITRPSVLDEMLLFLIAGHETTSHTMSWLCMNLAAHPAVQSKCHDAILRATSSSQPSQLPEYVEAALLESMRLYPTVPGPTRQVTKVPFVIDVPVSGPGFDVVGGEEHKCEGQGQDRVSLSLPVGTHVNINLLSLQRCEATWGKDAHLYRPERWIDSGLISANSIDYFGGAGFSPDSLSFAPFAFGQRRCVCVCVCA